MERCCRNILNITFVIFVISFFSCSRKNKAPLPEKDTEKLELKGNVLSVKTISFTGDSINGKFENRERKRDPSEDFDAVIVFNAKGFETEKSCFDDNGNSLYTYFYKYDSNNRMLEEKWVGGKGGFPSIYGYVLDANGYLVQKTNITDGKNLYVSEENEYDEKGNRIQSVRFGRSGDEETKTMMKYDKNNKLTEYTLFYKGNLMRREVQVTDSLGNIIETSAFNEHKIMENRDSFFYDADRRMKYQVSYLSKGRSGHREKKEFDSNGKCIKTSYFDSDGKENSYTVHLYDDHGNCTGDIDFESNGKVLRKNFYRFEYDATGNWIRKASRKDGGKIFLTEREITYFK